MSTSDKKLATYTTFDENYKERTKIFWYSAGRPECTVLKSKLENEGLTNEGGKTPSLELLRKWVADGWHEWADIMDARASELVETEIVQQKASMLREQALRGQRLQELGMAYLENQESGGFDSGSSAVNAVIRGAELERTSRGIGDALLRMAKMTDEELKQEIISQLERASRSNQIIEAEEVKPDTESKDIENSSQ